RLVLNDAEQRQLAALPCGARGPEILLRFSLKEAIIKSLDPLVRRPVALREVTIEPDRDGTALVRLPLRPGEGPFAAEANWLAWDEGLFLSTARLWPVAS